MYWRWDSSVGLVVRLGLAGAREFSLVLNVQPISVASSASYSVSIGDSLPGVKWPGHEVDHLPSI